MIVLKNGQMQKIDGTDAFRTELDIQVAEETPDTAVGMLYGGLTHMVDLFIQTHDPNCPCVQWRIAKNIRYHLEQIEEENKTIIAQAKLNANKKP